MINLTDRNEVVALQSNLRATFGSPQGQETMLFLESIGSWCPTIHDSMETNDIVSRDANRRLIGTIKTILELSPEQIIAMATQGE